ncbi:MAG: hypothetical protein K2N94_09900 [Lachnospiraceae bacterium]|nr:hypothetical protein [Lachnospiraceae bacterium]
MSKMKKLLSFSLALVLSLTLIACGGPDTSAAIDAHNKAGKAINELNAVLNADPTAYADFIAEMNAFATVLNECGKLLEEGKDVNGNELSQEALDAWEKQCGEIEKWAIDTKAQLEK